MKARQDLTWTVLINGPFKHALSGCEITFLFFFSQGGAFGLKLIIYHFVVEVLVFFIIVPLLNVVLKLHFEHCHIYLDFNQSDIFYMNYITGKALYAPVTVCYYNLQLPVQGEN